MSEASDILLLFIYTNKISCVTAIVTKRSYSIGFNEILRTDSSAQNFGKVHYWAKSFQNGGHIKYRYLKSGISSSFIF